MTTFTCPVCGRAYSTDSSKPFIVRSMAAYAAECEQQCRQRVEAKYGAGQRSQFELAALYRKLSL